MIGGVVDAMLEPIVELELHGPHGRLRRIAFVVDTGYTGGLALPPSIIQDLNLEWKRSDRAILADGSIVQYDCFSVEVVWDSTTSRIEADESDTASLLGTALLRGYELKAEMRPRGKLTLKRLPPKKRKT